MNKERRKQLGDAANAILDVISDIESIKDEETGAFENTPEALQCAKEDAYDEAIDSMDGFIDDLQNVADAIEEMVNV